MDEKSWLRANTATFKNDVFYGGGSFLKGCFSQCIGLRGNQYLWFKIGVILGARPNHKNYVGGVDGIHFALFNPAIEDRHALLKPELISSCR